MKRLISVSPAIILLGLLLVLSGTDARGQCAGTIIYVNQTASGANDGSSWTDAFTDLQSALAAFCPGAQIWVAAGTYKPTTGTDRTISFVMQTGMALYGGFSGTETLLSQRNWKTNVTTLSGDIGTPADNIDNSYHVVFSTIPYGQQIIILHYVLDGFTITGGNASGDDYYGNGAGIYIGYSSPTVTNCIFYSNLASNSGGGMYNMGYSSPTLTNCLFVENRAYNVGGGMYNHDQSSPTLINCSFLKNSADQGGGGLYNFSSSATLTNCSFSGNWTYGSGAGVVNGMQSSSTLSNCIFWGNRNGFMGDIDNYFDGTATVNYSIVQGGYAGTGNLDVDPLFVNAANGNLRLQPCSPAIDAGNDAASSIPTDLDGAPRTVNAFAGGSLIDMGAYEYPTFISDGTRWYVNAAATTAGTGVHWACAFQDLQMALAVADAGDEIWVATGTYKPTTGTDRNISFVMKNSVAIYGGFAGTETLLSQRNWTTNVTTLSGDIGTVGDKSDNSYHVIYNNGNGLTNTAVLDGFVITKGNAESNTKNGAGMYNFKSSPTVINCSFTENSASTYNGFGGGMANYESWTRITNCSFSGNDAGLGGGIFNYGFSSPKITNCTFSGNWATYGGGGIRNDKDCHSWVINCSFYGNTAEFGGAISNAYSFVIVTNAILWGNSSSISNLDTKIDVTYSIIQGGYTGEGNVDVDPMFVNTADPDGPDNIWMTADDGLALQSNSPAINAGLNKGAPPTDIVGKLRPLTAGDPADMGAFEAPTCTKPVITCPENISVNNATTLCSATVTYTVPVSGWPEPDITYSFAGATLGSGSGNGSGSIFEVGVTTVTVTAANSCGPVDCVFTVEVADKEPPVIIGGTIDACYASVEAAEAAAIAATSATDNCPGELTKTAITIGDCSTIVTVSVTDAHNNKATIGYTTRIDNTPPMVTPTFISSCYPTVAAAEAAALEATTATDNCDGVLTETATTVGDCSAVIMVITTDGCGNATIVSYSTRIDNTPPVVTPTSIAGCYPTVAAAEAAALEATSATDNCTGALTETVYTEGDCSAVITVTTADGCGNTTTILYKTHIDNTPPIVTPGSIASCYPTVAAAEAAALEATSATDNCPGILTEKATTVGDCSAVITIITTDGCGNETKVSYNTRIDNTPPVVSPGSIASCYPTVAAAEAAALEATSATDNCDGVLTESAITAGDCSAVIMVTTTDGCGNATTVRYITRIDNTPPVVTPGSIASCYPTLAAAETAALEATSATDNCDGALTETVSTEGDCSAVITVITTDGCGNATPVMYHTRIDNTPPIITDVSVSQASLWPANHKMRDIMVGYIATDICGGDVMTTLAVKSNEPINGTGDGDISPDYEVIDNRHVRLRAERAGSGSGRVYTITITATDVCGNQSTKETTVVVAHNITAPVSGRAFKIGSTVSFAGTFWDVPGNRHTARWVIDGTAVSGRVTAEPSGLKNGTVTGSYRFNSAGVYKLRMEVIDQKGNVSYTTANGDLDAIVVIYDPNGGYTYGGGNITSPAGAIPANPQATGLVSYGFQNNYFKTSTNPKGETQMEFKVGEFEFNALNYEYLAIDKFKAQFSGSGRIIGGQSGISFIMTVIDGNMTGGDGVDKLRMKVFNKNTGEVYYDNQPGAGDADDPLLAINSGSTVVIGGSETTSGPGGTKPKATTTPDTRLELIVYNNPATGNQPFRLQVQSTDKQTPISLRITDVSGRAISAYQHLAPGTTIQAGSAWTKGLYLAEATQQGKRVVVKMLKQ